MQIPSQLPDMIKRFEGLNLNVYRDAVSIRTCGYGHVLLPGENFTQITEQEAEDFLIQDVTKAVMAVNRLINITLNENQLTALSDFVFNLGAGCLQASTLRMQINRDDLIDADQQFSRWCFAGARKLPGLIARRKAEAELFDM